MAKAKTKKAASKTDAAKAQREAKASPKKKPNSVEITHEDLENEEEETEGGEEEESEEEQNEAEGLATPADIAESANPDVPHVQPSGSKPRATRTPAGDKRGAIYERWADRIVRGAINYGDGIPDKAHNVAVQLRELATLVKGKSPASSRRAAVLVPKIGDILSIRKSGHNVLDGMVKDDVAKGQVELIAISSDGKKLKLRSKVDPSEVFFLNVRNVQAVGTSGEEEDFEEEETEEEETEDDE